MYFLASLRKEGSPCPFLLPAIIHLDLNPKFKTPVMLQFLTIFTLFGIVSWKNRK